LIAAHPKNGRPGNHRPAAPAAEEELRIAQARLEFLMTASPVVIYSDKPLPGYPTNFISPNVMQLLGCTPEDVCRPGWYKEHLHPQDSEQMAGSLDRILSGDVAVHEYRLRHRDGRYRWIRDRTHLVRDADGQPLEIVGSLEDITDVRQADARFRAMADAAPQGIWLVDTQAALIYANQAELTNLGLTWDEARGNGWQRAVHPDDRARIAEGFGKAIAEGRAWSGSGRMVHSDGSTIVFQAWGAPVRDDDGGLIGFVGQTADVTEERRAASALVESESRFRDLVSNLDVGVWTFDPANGVMQYVSPGYERMFGLTLEQFNKDPWAWLESIHPDDRDAVRLAVEESPELVDIEYRFERPEGGWGWVRGRTFPVRDEVGAVRLIAGLATDISAEREAQEELRGSIEFKSALLDASPAIIVGLDDKGSVTLWNAAAERILGWSAAEVVGMDTLPPMFPEGEPVMDWPPKAAITNIQMQPLRKDGEPVDLNVSLAPLTDRHGTVIGGIGVAIDVTDHLRAEADRARVMAVLDDEAKAREELNAVVARLVAQSRPEDAADAICDELLGMHPITMASVLAFDHDGSATPLAFRGPVDSPVSVGRPIPAARAEYVRQRAEQSSWVEEWPSRDEGGGYGKYWAKVGLVSVAYLPIHAQGELAGVVIVGTTQADGAESLVEQLPSLHELAAIASALLAPQLRARMENGKLRGRIEQLISAEEFTPVFQPVVDLASSSVVGYEALTRFSDGTSPELVFAQAEEAGLGIEMELATLTRALTASESLPPGPWLALNISPPLAVGPDLEPLMHGHRRQLVVEITERTAIEDYLQVQGAMAALGENVRLAVDDAGAGFASLRHIVELRPQFVKLDMGLVRNIDRDPARQALVAGMVYFAGETGCALIAEGIETDAERRVLRRLGVTFGQGFLLGRPAEGTAFAARYAISSIPRPLAQPVA
jgi:PAS domain S-box-containing protein